ncbi:MAG: PEP-CTERM sorting domain-containing protein [Hassallia sp. WJT32-NPBG1]|jgi:hypothetical protein|nr:PEP-CTERM sorting domain-containing protein [Hassallia sp. WJT32-NPBG1]
MKFKKQFSAIAKSVTVSNLAKEMMNYKKSLAFIGLLTSSALALSSNPAQAFNFTTEANTCPTAASKGYTNDGFQLLAGGTKATLACKTVIDKASTDDGYVGSVTGIGVNSKDNKTAGEIGILEYIDVIFPKVGVLKSLDLSFLYQPGEFSDKVYEVAAVSTDKDKSTGLGTLRVKNDNTAVWSWLGGTQDIKAKSNSTDGNKSIQGGGWYSINNPFDNIQLGKLRLTALSGSTTSTGYKPDVTLSLVSSQNSDFALVGAELKSVTVPEPTTLAGLAIVGGLLLATRRKAIQS